LPKDNPFDFSRKQLIGHLKDAGFLAYNALKPLLIQDSGLRKKRKN
jgi:hypothetical protein